MEHPHTIAHIMQSNGEGGLGWEVWPLSRRSYSAKWTLDTDGPITIIREVGEPRPIVQIGRTGGWRMGAERSVYVSCEDAAGKQFALLFDQGRLFEAVSQLLKASSVWGADEIEVAPWVFAEGLEIVEETQEYIAIDVRMVGNIKLRVILPPDALEAMVRVGADDESPTSEP